MAEISVQAGPGSDKTPSMSQDAHAAIEPSDQRSSPAWQWAFDGVLAILVVAGLVAFGASGVPSLRQRAGADAYTITSLRLVDRPAWMDDELLRPLARNLKDNIELGGVSHDSLELARTLLERSGWFDRVWQLSLEEGALIIRADYATPCALVETGGREWLVGSRGQRLPRDYAPSTGPKMVRVRGVGAAPPEMAGDAWEGEPVAAALRTIALMESRPWFPQVARLDVSDLEGEGLVIETTHGTRFRWGSTAVEPTPGQLPPAQRIAVLDMLNSQVGSLDRTGYDEIDLTLDITLGRRNHRGALAAAD